VDNYLQKNKPMFAFNIWDIFSAKAVLKAAAQKEQNVILQTSASVFEKTEKKLLRDFVKSYAEELGIRAWLHLDHCKDEELIKQAVRSGWDSVMIDASEKEIEKNIEITNKIVTYAHENNVLVEAEVGQLKGSEDGCFADSSFVASYEDIDLFCKNTRVDMIAVAFGNVHGKYKGVPQLEYELVKYTIKKSHLPFVVHGASGLSVNILEHLLAIQGVKKINVSTEVKLSYRMGVLNAYREGLLEEDGFQAVDVSEAVQVAITNMVCEKLDILKGK